MSLLIALIQGMNLTGKNFYTGNLTGKNLYRNLKIPLYLGSTRAPYEVLSLQYFQETLDIFTRTDFHYNVP